MRMLSPSPTSRVDNRRGWALWLAALLFLVAISLAPSDAAEWRPYAVPAGELTADSAVVYCRCFIRVPDNMTSRAPVDLWSDSAMFSLADLPGPFAIFLNGTKIGEEKSLPAVPRRRFKIPKGILEKGAFNVLAVRMEGAAAKSGLRTPPVLHGYHDELVLDGTWEFFAGEPAEEELRPLSTQPARAFFTEAKFREASTPLGANEEVVRGERLPPAESLVKIRAGNDLTVELLLAEPIVAQPTHFSFDARGRLWVAQYRQYPYPAGVQMISRDKYYRSKFDRVPPAPPNHDRGRDIISVHEDTDGDGMFDTHREVLTGLNMANAVLAGHGGIWVMHTPYLLFYPDANGDDVPDGDPEVRLAGFGLEDTHSIANGLAWGPDGWIYGAQGSTTTSHVRRPGLDRSEAPGVYHEACMVWRYHPRTRAYEIFAEGGGNTFGVEFDSEGRLYSGHNGGETRGWHFVQSGIYLKQGKDPGKFGPPTNPYAFVELPMMKSLTTITRFSHHFAVGEGEALPPKYQRKLFSADPLHHNVVLSEQAREGATFTTSDIGSAFESEDKSVRPVYVANAPDGSIYVADFYEQYIAHGQHYQGQIDSDSGRIYRIRGRDLQLTKDLNLERKTTAQLIKMLGHPNKWQRQAAARLLGERRDLLAKESLRQLLGESDAHPALEALWALHQAEWIDEATINRAIAHPAAPLRAWIIRLLGDARKLPAGFASTLLEAVATEPDAEVRCQIAATARRLSVDQALGLVAAVLQRDADGDDPFIPGLCWCTIESFCDTERERVLALFAPAEGEKSTRPDRGRRIDLWSSTMSKEHLLPKLMRRFAAKGSRTDLLICARLLRAAPTEEHRKILVAGFEQAFKGRSLPALPDELVTALAEAGQNSPELRLRRGDAEAVGQALTLLRDAKAARDERLRIIRVLGEIKERRALPVLVMIVRSEEHMELRKASLAALAQYDDGSIGSEITAAYPNLPAAVQSSAQSVLASRPDWSLAFLQMIERGGCKASDVTAEALARLRLHADQSVRALTSRLFPDSTRSPNDAARLAIERVKRVLKGGSGNPYAGELTFMQRCAACHELFHKGGRIGPNLTSYQRDDLTTMLPSIVDPSAEIREGFINYIVQTSDGRVLSGFLADQDANVLVLRGFDGQDVHVPRAEVRELKPTGASLMPAGLLEGLTDQELRDFFAYLRIPQPITR